MTPHGRWLIRFLPTFAAIAYFGLVASDRYVAEAQFVVRTASKPSGSVGIGALLQATGLTRSNDEIYSVQSYITSRNAAMELRKRLPIDAIYGSAKADLIARYPSVIFGPTLEELYDYLSWMISTSYSSTTGITTLQVQAFTPEDAQSVAMTLLQLGELTVNELNNRIRTDAVRVAEAEVKLAENRLVDAQVEITRFRNSEVTIDPASSLVILSELIARLGAELTKTEAQTREIAAAAATNPQLPSLQRRATAIKQQIEQERQRIASADQSGLANKLAIYERLVLNREFAKQALSTSVKSFETAQLEARRKQLYLERVVEPIVTDHAIAPQRLRHVAAAFGINVIGLLVLWLIYGGIREHGVTHER